MAKTKTTKGLQMNRDPDVEQDVLRDLREMAANNAQPDCDIATLNEAITEIERLREIVRRLNDLSMSATRYIANKGISDDFRKNLALCQRVDLEPERIREVNRNRTKENSTG